MKYTIQDDDGGLYDADYPDGTDIVHILAEAKAKLGKNVRHYDPAKQPPAATGATDSAATKREIERMELAVARELKKAEGLRARIAQAEAATVAAEQRVTDARLGRSEATAATKNAEAKLYTCEQALEQERKARAKAEATADRLRSEMRALQSAPEPRQLVAWSFEVVSRDSNGFTREMRMVPEYSKVTVQ